MATAAIRTTCLKCNKTIRAMDSESWSNIVTESELLRVGFLRTWWVHGVKCRVCPAGGHHNPERY